MVNSGKNAKVTQKLRKCYAISEGLFAFSSGCYVLKNANLHLMVLFFCDNIPWIPQVHSITAMLTESFSVVYQQNVVSPRRDSIAFAEGLVYHRGGTMLSPRRYCLASAEGSTFVGLILGIRFMGKAISLSLLEKTPSGKLKLIVLKHALRRN